MNTAPRLTTRPALRPYATAGVALVGASLLAAAPVVAPPAEIHVPDIQLTAGIGDGLVDVFSGFDPTFGWLDVLGTSANNVASIAQGVLDNGAPALAQFLSNQLGYGTTLLGGLQGGLTGTLAWFFDDQAGNNLGFFLDGMVDLIKAGDFVGAGSIFNSGVMSLLFSAALPLTPALMIPGEIASNLDNIVQAAPGALLGFAATGLMAPLLGVDSAFFDTVQAISDAANPLEGFSAFLNAPASLTGAFLNGWETLGDLVSPGLLTPLLPDGAGTGPLAFLVEGIPQLIAQAIGDDATGGLTGVLSGFADTAMAVPQELMNTLSWTFDTIFDVGSLTDIVDVGSLTAGLTDLFDIGGLTDGLTGLLNIGDVASMLDPMMFIAPLLAMFGM